MHVSCDLSTNCAAISAILFVIVIVSKQVSMQDCCVRWLILRLTIMNMDSVIRKHE